MPRLCERSVLGGKIAMAAPSCVVRPHLRSQQRFGSIKTNNAHRSGSLKIFPLKNFPHNEIRSDTFDWQRHSLTPRYLSMSTDPAAPGYTGVDNLEIMEEAKNYNAFLRALVTAQAAPKYRILDFGAGSGALVRPLAAAGYHIC